MIASLLDMKNQTLAIEADQGDNQKAKKQTMCVICTGEITNPKFLTCFHSFCRECIDNWLKIKKNCPTCRAKQPE